MEDLPIITRYDIRRLEKAAREKDKKHLNDFLKQFENQTADTYRKAYDSQYTKTTEDFADVFTTIMVYNLFFSDETLIDKSNIHRFIDDMNATFILLGKGELSEKEIKESLQNEGIAISDRLVDPFSLVREERNRLNELYSKYDKALDDLYKCLNKLKTL